MKDQSRRRDGAGSRQEWRDSPLWSDQTLLEGVRRRDETALGKFFDLAFPYVYSLAYRLTHHKERAEDLTQEVFLKIYRAADRLETNLSAKPWVTTIVYNAVRDEARRSAARPELSTDAAEIGTREAGAETPEGALVRQEREAALEKALEQLDFESRVIVLLHSYCDHSHDAIAGLMGISHAAVRKRYSRALEQMTETVRKMTS